MYNILQKLYLVMLVRVGANVDSRDHNDWSPLHCTVYTGLYRDRRKSDISNVELNSRMNEKSSTRVTVSRVLSENFGVWKWCDQVSRTLTEPLDIVAGYVRNENLPRGYRLITEQLFPFIHGRFKEKYEAAVGRQQRSRKHFLHWAESCHSLNQAFWLSR